MLTERRVPRQAAKTVEQLSLSSFFSLSLCRSLSISLTCSLTHSLSLIGSMSLALSLASYWGGTSSLYALQLRLSVKPSTPPPCWHRQRESEEKEEEGVGEQGLTHITKVAPTEAKAPHTLQIFTPSTHTHSSMHTQLLFFFSSLSHSSHCT